MAPKDVHIHISGTVNMVPYTAEGTLPVWWLRILRERDYPGFLLVGPPNPYKRVRAIEGVIMEEEV